LRCLPLSISKLHRSHPGHPLILLPDEAGSEPTVSVSYREPWVCKGRCPIGQCLLTCFDAPQQVSCEAQTAASCDRGARLSTWSRCNLVTVACRPFTMPINVVSYVCFNDSVVAAATFKVGSVVVSSSPSVTCWAVKSAPEVHLLESRLYPSSRPPLDC